MKPNTDQQKADKRAEQERLAAEALKTYRPMFRVEMGLHEKGPAASAETVSNLGDLGVEDAAQLAHVLAVGISTIRRVAEQLEKQTGLPMPMLLTQAELHQALHQADGGGVFLDLLKQPQTPPYPEHPNGQA